MLARLPLVGPTAARFGGEFLRRSLVGSHREWSIAALVALATIFVFSAPCAAREQVYGFQPADREALQVWADILRRDQGLARDARRHRFRPHRDLAVLRVDMDADGRTEMVLYANLMPFCGSAGCMTRILTRRGNDWTIACETYVEDGNGLIIDDARTAGWRNFRGTYRVSWVANVAKPVGVACIEGETVDRAEQGRAR